MPRPRLCFKAHANSLSVKVLNMESLEVAQIMELEAFVRSRRGVFDFEHYTFALQKRVTFEEFDFLLKSLGIDVSLEEEFEVSPTEPRVAFGQYKGLRFSEIPDGYLEWLKRNYFGSQKNLIEKEIEKRAAFKT